MDDTGMERRARLVRAQRIVGIAVFVVVVPSVFFFLLGLFVPDWRNFDSSTAGFDFGYLVFGGTLSMAAGGAVGLFSRLCVEHFFDRKLDASRIEERQATRQRNAQRAADQRRRMRG